MARLKDPSVSGDFQSCMNANLLNDFRSLSYIFVFSLVQLRRTSLIVATLCGHTDIVRELLLSGADANLADKVSLELAS